MAIAALTQAVILGWAFLQLREEAVEGLAEDVALAGQDPTEQSRLARWLGRPVPEPDPTRSTACPRPVVAPGALGAATLRRGPAALRRR